MTLTPDRLPAGLPPGSLVAPDARFSAAGPAGPVLWVCDEPLPEAEAGLLWGRLLREHRLHGLWPLLLGARVRGERLRPWHSGELDPRPFPAAGEVDLEEQCALGWEELTEGLVPAPYPAWPGLAPPAEPGADPDGHAVALAGRPEGAGALMPGGDRGPYLGLVAAPDGAAAVTGAGWRPEVGGETVAAMVRSWQRRFGARLCSLGGVSTVAVTVAWPPRTPDHARRVAAEHFALCPDLLQVHEDFQTYATSLVDAEVWSLWWD